MAFPIGEVKFLIEFDDAQSDFDSMLSTALSNAGVDIDTTEIENRLTQIYQHVQLLNVSFSGNYDQFLAAAPGQIERFGSESFLKELYEGITAKKAAEAKLGIPKELYAEGMEDEKKEAIQEKVKLMATRMQEMMYKAIENPVYWRQYHQILAKAQTEFQDILTTDSQTSAIVKLLPRLFKEPEVNNAIKQLFRDMKAEVMKEERGHAPTLRELGQGTLITPTQWLANLSRFLQDQEIDIKKIRDMERSVKGVIDEGLQQGIKDFLESAGSGKLPKGTKLSLGVLRSIQAAGGEKLYDPGESYIRYDVRGLFKSQESIDAYFELLRELDVDNLEEKIEAIQSAFDTAEEVWLYGEAKVQGSQAKWYEKVGAQYEDLRMVMISAFGASDMSLPELIETVFEKTADQIAEQQGESMKKSLDNMLDMLKILLSTSDDPTMLKILEALENHPDQVK